MTDHSKIFFLHGHLHSAEQIRRTADVMMAFDWHDLERRRYILSEVRKHQTKAFTIKETAEMLDRAPVYFRRVYIKGHNVNGRLKDTTKWLWQIVKPQAKLKWDKYGRLIRIVDRWYLSEDMVLKFRDFIDNVGPGASINKDGMPKKPHKPVPSKGELLAKMHDRKIMYVKNDDGEYVPAWPGY